MGFSGNHLTSDLTENLPSAGTPGDLLSAFADRGDEAAFAEIVRRYAGMVFATCLKSTKDAHDAEDATQAVFLSLAVQIKTGKAVRALGPWLKQVAKRAGLDVRKSRKRRERREQAHAQNTAIELGCPDGVLGTPTPRITEYAQAASDPEELQRLVSQELNGLPATYRLPLISQYFGGLSQKQIATQLGIKPGAVAVRIHRGRVMLAKRLESLGAELPPGWSSGEDEPSVYACIGSAVSSMMVARIAQSMGQLGLGHGVTGNTTASLLSIARTAAAGAAAAAKLKIAIAVVLCASLAASATTWAKNAEIDFSSFPSLRPVIDFIRNLGGSRSITPMASSTSVSTPAPTTVATNQTAVATLPTLSNLPAGPTSPAFVPQTPVAGFTPGTALPTAPLSVASAGSVNVGVPPVPSLPQVASVEPAAARPAGESPASASILLAPETHTASSSAKRELDVSVGTGIGSRVATGDVTLTGSGWLRTALSGTSESVVTPGHALNIGSGVGSVGQLTMRNDNLVADAQNIGVYGTGRLQQLDGGFNTATQINLGVGPTGSGIYDLAGTAVLRPSVASASGATGFSVGGHGHGELNLGDGKVAGMVWEASALSAQSTIPAAAKPMDLTSLLADPAHLIVRSEADGSGVIRGWGGANGNGSFVNNGVVTADGYGKERSLIFTGYTSVTNTIENLDGQHNGWFAQNLGRLRLPKLRVDSGTNTYTWGEDEKDTTLDLVNSVRVTLHDMPAADSLEINLLDKARADVPTLPTGHTFIGVWSFDTLAARPGSVDLTIRYDDALAQELKLNEGNLKIWEYVNGTWTRLDHDPSFTRDVADHILSATADGKLTYFAVSAPEPGSVGMLMILGSGMLLRRRRRLQPHR